MPRRPSYVPKHRADIPAQPGSGLRGPLARTGAAAAATGLAVSAGVVLTGGTSTDPAAAQQALAPVAVGSPSRASDTPAPDVLRSRERAASRSLERTAVDSTKVRALSQASGGQVAVTEDLTTGDPRAIAKALLAKYGFGQDQFSCLDSIYVNESGWNVHADNPSSSAYGIPQALPGSKMSSAGPDWEDNPATQIEWGLGYIKSRYGTPCNAWGFKQGHGWY